MSNSNSTSASSSKININLQARVLAFQEQRQQLKRSGSQNKQTNHGNTPNSTKDSPFLALSPDPSVLSGTSTPHTKDDQIPLSAQRMDSTDHVLNLTSTVDTKKNNNNNNKNSNTQGHFMQDSFTSFHDTNFGNHMDSSLNSTQSISSNNDLNPPRSSSPKSINKAGSLPFITTPAMSMVNKPLPPLPPLSSISRSNSVHSSQHSVSRSNSVNNKSIYESNPLGDLEARMKNLSTSSLQNYPINGSNASINSLPSRTNSFTTKNTTIAKSDTNHDNSTMSNHTANVGIKNSDLYNMESGSSEKHGTCDSKNVFPIDTNNEQRHQITGTVDSEMQNNLNLDNTHSGVSDSNINIPHSLHINEPQGNSQFATEDNSSAQPCGNKDVKINGELNDGGSKPSTPTLAGFKKFMKQVPGPLRKPPPIPKNIPMQLNQNQSQQNTLGALNANLKKPVRGPMMPMMPNLSQSGEGAGTNSISEAPRQQSKIKMGLSARRGMKLNLSSLNNPIPNASSKPASNQNSVSNTGISQSSIGANVNSVGLDNKFNMANVNKLHMNRAFNTTATSTVISTESTNSSSSSESGTDSIGVNTMDSLLAGGFNSHSTNSRNSLLSNNTRSLNMDLGNNNSTSVFHAGNSINSVSSGNKSVGLFANFSKYVNIKSGSLNFAGKLSLSSKGIDFSNGSSFRITLDELEYIGELGRGNYGNVSKVLHKPTNIVMAMKEVRLELDESKFRQILMELDVLHRCNSPYIVDFYGAFFIEGAVYMCMECMDGGSLDKLYTKIPDSGGVDEPRLAYIAISVINGLKTLKDEHNIIHRDVKPTNILCSALQGTVKLCDFGVSGNLVASLAKTNIGCQSYMAPERIKSFNPDAATYTVQSDIWSLGLSLLELALGKYPYPPETYDNIFSQLSAIVDGQPPRLPEGHFSPEAQDFINRCLEKQPERRPSYAMLLEHPWLKKYTNVDVGMKDYLTQRVHDIEEYEREHKSATSEVNEARPIPALHRGGLSN